MNPKEFIRFLKPFIDILNVSEEIHLIRYEFLVSPMSP